MSSPFRASADSRSTPRSSPSRQRLADSAQRNGRVNGYHRAYRDSPSNESPSQQLLEDFSRIVLDDDRNFRRSLDAKVAEQEKLHRLALDESLRQHEAVRQSAERARERVELEIRREQKRREEQERQAVEEQRRKLAEEEAESERRRLEDARKAESDRRQREELKRQQDEQSRQAEAQRQRDEKDRADRKAAQEKAEADRKAREEAAARERQRQAQQPQPPPTQPSAQQPNGVNAAAPPPSQPAAAQPKPSATAPTAAPGLVTTIEQRKDTHRRYIELWRKLKTFRATTEKQCKDAGFKELGDMKRKMRTQVGMLNKHDKAANRQSLIRIEEELKKAAQITNPSVDITEFLVPTTTAEAAEIAAAPDKQYPAVLLYLLHQLAKTAIRQLVGESSSDTEMADPLGIVLVQVFARPTYLWNSRSVIDVLWAKYHRLCPQLFGVPGREGVENEYWWRVTGLSAGFSAITLRDFSQSKTLKSPAPNRLWWEAVARILNLTPNEIQRTHYVILKAMTENFVPTIVKIFGGAGKAVLKKAVREFVQKAPRDAKGSLVSEAMALETLQMTLQSKYGLTL